MIFPSRNQLASKQIRRTGRAEAVAKEGLAATLLPGRQPDQMGQRHSLRPVRPRSCPGALRNGSLCCISTRMWALPWTAEQDQELVADELATQVDEDRRSAGQARAVLLAAAGRRAFEPQAVRRHAGAACGATCAGRLAPTARTSWRTRVAEDRRERDVAQKPSAVAGTAQSGSIRRPEQQGKGYRTWQKCENRCIAAGSRLSYTFQDGQTGNPGLIKRQEYNPR